MKKWSILFLLLHSVVSTLCAQYAAVFRSDIKTLRCEQNNKLEAFPLLRLGTDDQFVVSFDQLGHTYHKYSYNLTHCDRTWKDTEGLFPSETFYGAAERIPIELRYESQNTTQVYTHHRFVFPNSEVQPRISGNYRLRIYDETEGHSSPIAELCFGVVERLVGIQAQVTEDTDWDHHLAHQQLHMQVDATALNTQDLQEELFSVVTQNHRWDNAKINPPATQIIGKRLQWQHQPALIFPATNEYRRFELLSMRNPGIGVDQLRWHEPYYHATLQTDKARTTYLYVEDQNGTAVIRNTENPTNDTESDYSFVHFSLRIPQIATADVYVNGQWTNMPFSPEWRMEYNETAQQYEASLLLKQGYYSYQYLVLPHQIQPAQGSHQANTAATEGNFSPTKNEYRIYIYHRSPAQRYDRLVGTHYLSKY